MNWKTCFHWFTNGLFLAAAMLCLYAGLFVQSAKLSAVDRGMIVLLGLMFGYFGGRLALYTLRKG